MELHWENISDFVSDFLLEATDHLYVMSPFISIGVLDRVLPVHPSATIITSWSPDFISKYPDALDVYSECKSRTNTALYLNTRLHAKFYAYDITKNTNGAIIGSANLTLKGLGIDAESNFEVVCKAKNISLKDKIYFQRILNNSILVTDEIFELYKEWLNKYNLPDRLPIEPIIDSEKDKQLLVTDLPLTDNPSRLWDLKTNSVKFNWWEEDSLIHDLSIFGGETADSKAEFFDELRDGFSRQVFIKEFLKNIDNDGIFFGRIKEWIQNNCYDVPTPRRRELTITVQALIKWVTELYPQKYEIVKPQYSECLRLKR